MTIENILLPYQKSFADAPQKKKIFLASRQIGKSFTLAYIATKRALLRGNKGLSLCISTGARAASELLKKVKQFAEATRQISKNKITYIASADKIEFSTGARVISLPSGNPAALRGYSASTVIIDEAAYIDNSDDVFQAIAPTLTRDQNAELILASTPAGMSGLFYDLWCQAGVDESWYRQATTIEDAVNDGLKADIEQLRALCNDDSMFEIEFMCQFSKTTGQFIDLDSLAFACECPFKNNTRRILGVDFGRHNDATAIINLIQSHDGLYVDDVVTLRNADWQSQFTFIKTLNDKYHFNAGYMDANGIGSAISEQVQKQINFRLKPFTTTGSNKTPMYEHFKGLVYDKRIIFNSKFQDIIQKDFQNVRKVVADNGKVSYVAGRSSLGHSDITSAIIFATTAAKDNPISASKPLAYNRMSVFG